MRPDAWLTHVRPASPPAVINQFLHPCPCRCMKQQPKARLTATQVKNCLVEMLHLQGGLSDKEQQQHPEPPTVTSVAHGETFWPSFCFRGSTHATRLNISLPPKGLHALHVMGSGHPVSCTHSAQEDAGGAIELLSIIPKGTPQPPHSPLTTPQASTY